MSRLLIVPPLPIAGVTATRGTGAANLATPDPKEAWVDAAPDGGSALLNVDLGQVRTFDTILLGYLWQAPAAAEWGIATGLDGSDAILMPASPLRVPDAAGHVAATSHALWHGAPASARYLEIAVTQPAGAGALAIGVLVIGAAFVAELGQEWGAGRQPIDTGVATALRSGGFATAEGARKLLFKWTFGDLSAAEAEQLETIALELGETAPGLVIEDAARTIGLRRRIHYGLFKRWAAFERRNASQTRWEIAIEEWI